MKKISGLFLVLVMTQFLFAQTPNEQGVAKAVEELRVAMINADEASLNKLTSPVLSYGHSSGRIEDKQSFISNIVSGNSDFVSISLDDQSIIVKDDVAIVRHQLNATTNDNGKPGEVHLKVLLVWQKHKGQWILLARQAVKAQ